MCAHRLGGNPDGLCCVRADTHDPNAAGGHTYESTSGVPEAQKEEL